MLKIYLQLRSILIKFLNIKSIIALKMETKKKAREKFGLSHIC